MDMDKPRWLDDEAEITQLLHWFIDILDIPRQTERKKSPTRIVNKKNLPALFRNDEQSDHEWVMIKSLAEEYQLIKIGDAHKRGPYEAEFANKRLIFNPQAESMLRDWLQRPQQLPYAQQWRNAVSKYAVSFSDQGDALANQRPVKITGKNAEEVITGFSELAHFIDKGLSMRQLSARCFWGHSKFLDGREELLTSLFAIANIRPRPIMVNVCLPDEFKGVLFIENHDSYVNAIATNKTMPDSMDFNHLALVYLSGFQGSAKRIRDPQGISLHFHTASKQNEKQRFENWWFENNNENWQTLFWGDLDYSGMSILKALRQRFTQTKAWRPGYDIMLEQINSGQGHTATLAGKQEQHDPEQTGCPYADNVLLPALRQTTLFIDQESV